MSLLARRILTDVSFRESIIILFECMNFFWNVFLFLPAKIVRQLSDPLLSFVRPSVCLSVCLFVLKHFPFHLDEEVQLSRRGDNRELVKIQGHQYIFQDQLAKCKKKKRKLKRHRMFSSEVNQVS